MQLDGHGRGIGDRQRLMAGENDAAAAARVRHDKAREDLDAADVESVERLVEQPGPELALGGEARQGDAPALALRERANEGVRPAREAEALEGGIDVGGRDPAAAEMEQEAQRFGDGEV